MNFNNDMLYLSLCALKNESPDIARIKDIDYDELFKICEFHKLTALVCYALETVITPENKWIEAKGKSIRKNMLLDLERSRIISFMEEKNIKYMPLKGVLIKDYYPKPGMRQMADNDIYFDGRYRAVLEKFMRSIGYKDVKYQPNDDEYKRSPFYNFEMHYALFSDYDSKVFNKYYSDLEKLLVKDENNNNGYHFSNEDFYIYFIAHEYKHFIHCGIGIRSLIDCGVLLKKFCNAYNWNYIKTETDKLGITDFENQQRTLCQKLLKDPDTNELTQNEVEMLEYFVSAGAYGTAKIGMTNSIKEKLGKGKEKITLKIKIKYIFSRLFPPMEFYKEGYPFFYRHKWLIPCCFLYRLYKAVFHKNNVVKIEMKMLKSKGL